MDYLNENEFQFQFSKEYSDEEACIFQLISNKKNDFLNFFVDFFMDLPGFMTIYKDKFFSKIKDFIEDKNYILSLKEKFEKKCDENNKEKELVEKNDMLGLKRKRTEENILSAYAAELKLLENDYPQIIDNNSDEFNFENVQIKKEKIDDEINCEDKIIEKENIDNDENKMNNNNNNELLDDNKNKKKISIKFPSKKKQINKNNKIKKAKDRNKSIKKSQLNGFLTPVKNIQVNNFVNNVFDNSVYSDYPTSVIKETSKSINSFYGINSRLDKIPKINIYRKKKNQINHSAKRLLDNIKDRLTDIGRNNAIRTKKRYLSDDKKMMEEMQKLNQIVNNNFYGKERQKSPDYVKNEDNNNISNLNDKDKDKNIVNCSKKKKIEKKNIQKPQAKITYNKNVFIILTYKDKKEGTVTKSEFIPESIFINKSVLSMKEIKSLYETVQKKEKILKKDNEKNNENIQNNQKEDIHIHKREKKSPKKKITKSVHIIKPRKSERIKKLQKIRKKKEREMEREKEAQSLLYKRILRSRRRKKFIGIKKLEDVQKPKKETKITKGNNKAKKDNKEKSEDKIKKDNKAKKENNLNNLKHKKDNKAKKEEKIRNAHKTQSNNKTKKEVKIKNDHKAQSNHKTRKEEKMKKNVKTQKNNKARKESKIKKERKSNKSEEKRFDSLGQSSLLKLDNIQTNNQIERDMDVSNIKNNEDEVLVYRTKCDDFLSEEERLTSNRRKGKLNNFVNNSNSNQNDIQNFNTLNAFNYLFTQKK